VERFDDWMKSKLAEVDAQLSSPPTIALLVREEAADEVMNAIRSWQGIVDFDEAHVDFATTPCRLFLLRPNPEKWVAFFHQKRMVQASDIHRIAVLCKSFEGKARLSGAPWLWPLNVPSVCNALLAREMAVGAKSRWQGHAYCGDRLERWMRRLQLIVPAPQGKILGALRDHYGHAVAFQMSWSECYTQQFWLLIIPAMVGVCFGVGGDPEGDDMPARVVATCVTTMWGFWAACRLYFRFMTMVHTSEEHDHPGLIDPRSSARSGQPPSRRPEDKEGQAVQRTALQRWLMFVFLGIPALTLLLVSVFTTQWLVAQLVMYIIWDWGDCINPVRLLDETYCDASEKHGFWGWAAEVGCDILLAILWEILFGLTAPLSEWLASIRGYRFHDDHKFLVHNIKIALMVFERIGFLAILAFFFAAQWESSESSEYASSGKLLDCGAYMFGKSDFRCLRMEVPLERRREIFERLTKGPFTVAPFVSILIKDIIPAVITQLELRGDIRSQVAETSKSVCGKILEVPKMLLRIAMLIFAYDGDGVGGPSFILKGSPWSELPREGTTASSSESMKQATQQCALKTFEAESEVLEQLMNFVFVLCFAPMRPLGVLFMLLSRVLEVHFDLFKLFYVRARPMPTEHIEFVRYCCCYMFGAVFFALVWHTGLNIFTYNNQLHEWGEDLQIGLGVFLVLLALSPPLMAVVYNEVWRSMPHAKFEKAVEKHEAFRQQTSDAVQSPTDRLTHATTPQSPIKRLLTSPMAALDKKITRMTSLDSEDPTWSL